MFYNRGGQLDNLQETECSRAFGKQTCMNYKDKIFLPYLMASHFCSATVVWFQLVMSLLCSENLFQLLHGQPCVNVNYLPIILLEATWSSCTRDVCKPLCSQPTPFQFCNFKITYLYVLLTVHFSNI